MRTLALAETEPSALPLQRLPKQTLHHAWAPKVGRTVAFTGRAQLHLWTMLEANPAVTRYCERPAWPEECEPRPSIDFWALRDGMPVCLSLQESAPPDTVEEPRLPFGLIVQTITARELDSHRVWIQNWLSLLPYLSTASSLNLDTMRTPVIEFFASEASFDDAERHFANIDPVLVRTAVISELHRGRLFSHDLIARPWDRHTRVVRASPRTHDAPQ